MNSPRIDLQSKELAQNQVFIKISGDRDIIKQKLDSKNNDKANIELHYNNLVSRLNQKDPTLTEVEFCNTNVLTQKPHAYLELFRALYENPYIVKVDLVNVSMKDSDCTIMVEALATCMSLQKLNVESNSLSSLGIAIIADMIEMHPSVRELKVANQRMMIGVEAEKALTNCVSRNTNITKLSYFFKEDYVGVLADKYIRRNVELKRHQVKTSKWGDGFIPHVPLNPYPFKKVAIPKDLKLQAQKLLTLKKYTIVLSCYSDTKPDPMVLLSKVYNKSQRSFKKVKTSYFWFFNCGSADDVI